MSAPRRRPDSSAAVGGSHGSDNFLGIYLNDHLGGSMMGIELAERIARQNASTDVGRVLAEVCAQIRSDRETLKDVMAALGVRPRLSKQVLAWLGEKASRLKPNGQLVGYSPLSLLIELETLSLGVAGKLGLWQVLEHARSEDHRLARFDFPELISRASSQLARLEEQRLAAAARAVGKPARPPDHLAR